LKFLLTFTEVKKNETPPVLIIFFSSVVKSVAKTIPTSPQTLTEICICQIEKSQTAKAKICPTVKVFPPPGKIEQSL
jgi:hypothetical protein